jgi:hypothetical protein
MVHLTVYQLVNKFLFYGPHSSCLIAEVSHFVMLLQDHFNIILLSVTNFSILSLQFTLPAKISYTFPISLHYSHYVITTNCQNHPPATVPIFALLLHVFYNKTFSGRFDLNTSPFPSSPRSDRPDFTHT